MHIRRRFEILAALDRLLSPRRSDHGQYRFVPGIEEGIDVGIVRTPGGDAMFALFAPSGWILRGFDHESPASPHAREEDAPLPAIYHEAPIELLALLQKHDREHLEATFCVWQTTSDTTPQRGDVSYPEDDPDGGMDYLMGLLFEDPDEYMEWAGYFYDVVLDAPIVRRAFSGETPLESVTVAVVLQRFVRQKRSSGELVIAAASPMVSSQAIRIVRKVTGGSLSDIRHNLELGPAGQIYRLSLSDISAMRAARAMVGEMLEVGVELIGYHILDEEQARLFEVPERQTLSPSELRAFVES